MVINSLGPTRPTPHPIALFAENAIFRATNSVRPTLFADDTEILPPDNTCAAGFELSSVTGFGGQVTVTAYGPGGSLGSIDVTPPDTFWFFGTEDWIFVGFSDFGGITRNTIEDDPISVVEAIDNLRFAECAPDEDSRPPGAAPGPDRRGDTLFDIGRSRAGDALR